MATATSCAAQNVVCLNISENRHTLAGFASHVVWGTVWEKGRPQQGFSVCMPLARLARELSLTCVLALSLHVLVFHDSLTCVTTPPRNAWKIRPTRTAGKQVDILNRQLINIFTKLNNHTSNFWKKSTVWRWREILRSQLAHQFTQQNDNSADFSEVRRLFRSWSSAAAFGCTDE